MVGHGGSSAGSYLADPTSPTPSHFASIVVTSTVRVNCCLDREPIYHSTFLKLQVSIVVPVLWNKFSAEQKEHLLTI